MAPKKSKYTTKSVQEIKKSVHETIAICLPDVGLSFKLNDLMLFCQIAASWADQAGRKPMAERLRTAGGVFLKMEEEVARTTKDHAHFVDGKFQPKQEQTEVPNV